MRNEFKVSEEKQEWVYDEQNKLLKLYNDETNRALCILYGRE